MRRALQTYLAAAEVRQCELLDDLGLIADVLSELSAARCDVLHDFLDVEVRIHFLRDSLVNSDQRHVG